MKTKYPNVLADEFKCFRKSSLVFSSRHQRLIDRYPEQWVAVYDGKIKAHDSSYESVLAQIDRVNVPRKLVIIRYIARNPMNMVL